MGKMQAKKKSKLICLNIPKKKISEIIIIIMREGEKVTVSVFSVFAG